MLKNKIIALFSTLQYNIILYFFQQFSLILLIFFIKIKKLQILYLLLKYISPLKKLKH